MLYTKRTFENPLLWEWSVSPDPWEPTPCGLATSEPRSVRFNRMILLAHLKRGWGEIGLLLAVASRRFDG